MTTGSAGFPNLEPNHVIKVEGLGFEVWCPFEIVNGDIALHSIPAVRTAIWAKEADPGEVECPVCEVLKGQLHYIGSPDCADDEGDT